MRDLPHHLKKLNRNVVRSAHREEMEEDFFNEAYRREMTVKQAKKQKKELKKQENKGRVFHLQTTEEQNDLRKHRTPQTRDRPRKAPAAKVQKKTISKKTLSK